MKVTKLYVGIDEMNDQCETSKTRRARSCILISYQSRRTAAGELLSDFSDGFCKRRKTNSISVRSRSRAGSYSPSRIYHYITKGWFVIGILDIAIVPSWSQFPAPSWYVNVTLHRSARDRCWACNDRDMWGIYNCNLTLDLASMQRHGYISRRRRGTRKRIIFIKKPSTSLYPSIFLFIRAFYSFIQNHSSHSIPDLFQTRKKYPIKIWQWKYL